jgi:hypothetical protein
LCSHRWFEIERRSRKPGAFIPIDLADMGRSSAAPLHDLGESDRVRHRIAASRITTGRMVAANRIALRQMIAAIRSRARSSGSMLL